MSLTSFRPPCLCYTDTGKLHLHWRVPGHHACAISSPVPPPPSSGRKDRPASPTVDALPPARDVLPSQGRRMKALKEAAAHVSLVPTPARYEPLEEEAMHHSHTRCLLLVERSLSRTRQHKSPHTHEMPSLPVERSRSRSRLQKSHQRCSVNKSLQRCWKDGRGVPPALSQRLTPALTQRVSPLLLRVSPPLLRGIVRL